MTDNEITKALERCNCKMRGVYCIKQRCPYFNVLLCRDHLMEDALDLINRQKAEIEDLKKVVVDDYASEYDGKIKAEAIKEFAKRLKEKSDLCYLGSIAYKAYRILEKDLDNLVKQITGEQQ